MTCVAKKQADGTYRLSGQKTWVTMGEKPSATPSSSPRTKIPAATTATCPSGTSRMDTPGVSTASLHKIGQQ